MQLVVKATYEVSAELIYMQTLGSGNLFSIKIPNFYLLLRF